MGERRGRCEHHVKRIRTYETPVSDPILLAAEVPSLQEICTQQITRHARYKELLAGLSRFGSISNPLAQLLLKYLDPIQMNTLIADTSSFLHDPKLCQIYEFKLLLRISDNLIAFLTKHDLRSASLCNSCDYNTLDQMSRSHKRLEHLDISYSLGIERFDPVFKFEALTFLNLERTNFKLTAISAHNFQWLSNLQWLGLSKLKKHSKSSPLPVLHLSYVNPKLLGLDLSETYWDLTQHAKLLEFKRLEVLDISQFPDTHTDDLSLFDEVLLSTVSKMISLRSLDVSWCPIQRYDAIMSLNNLKLEFLGAVGVHVNLTFIDTLAKKVATQQTLEGTLLQLYKYSNNMMLLEQAIRDLYNLHSSRTELGYNCEAINPRLFEAVLYIGERYTGHPTIQQVVSACLYSLNHIYFVKYKNNDPARFEEPYPGHERHVRRGLILLLMGVLDNMDRPEDVLQNCVGIINDYIMYDEEYMSLEVTHVMMQVLEEYWSEPILSVPPNIVKITEISNIALQIINRCMCQAPGPKKSQLGEMKLIELILMVSRCAFQLFRRDPYATNILIYKILLGQAWSTLWNITDEQADNCDRFIAAEGLDLYHETFNTCKLLYDKHITTLVRNMLGLMGNIAEVEHIRVHLTTDDLLKSFFLLREYDGETQNRDRCDIIEIRYSAAGILSHICSDGPERWRSEAFSFDEILEGIEQAVVSWDHKSCRSINYKSFHPILNIIKAEAPYPCKLWAVWALTNLCEFKPKRFVPMLRRDGGVELLERLRHEQHCPGHIRRLCTLTLVLAYDKDIGNDIEDISVV